MADEAILDLQTGPQEPPLDHHDRLYGLLMDEDEITWQALIMGLVKEEGMDPWDIDVSLLTKRYIQALKKIKEMNLRVSGKVLLAAALLVRIKSTRLVGEDLMAFDQMLASGEQSDDLLYEGEDGSYYTEEQMKKKLEAEKDFRLVPRTPQPRKRKVSVVDLIEALEQALHVKRRRVLRQDEDGEHRMRIPEKAVDLSTVMDELYRQIEEYLSGEDDLFFHDLCPEDSTKQEKVFTFLPLLHLATGRKIDLHQKVHFGEIGIDLAKADPLKKEI